MNRLLTLVASILPAAAAAQESPHGYHPAMPGQEYVLRGSLGSTAFEAPLRLDAPNRAADLDRWVTLHQSAPPLRLKRYLPRGVLEQEFHAAAPGVGRPGLQLAVNGPTQSYRRWLVAGERGRNSLLSYIGTWRFQAISNPDQRRELLQQFRDELHRRPEVHIALPGQPALKTIPAIPGSRATIAQLSGSVTVQAFYPHFGIDAASEEPRNLSDERVNPAVLVAIEKDGRSEERWVFSRFPDFSGGSDTTSVNVTLDCPTAKKTSIPDYLLVSDSQGTIEVWRRQEGRVTASLIRPRDPVPIPGSQYSFAVTDYVSCGTLREIYRPATGRGGVPALEVEMADASGTAQARWLKRDSPVVLQTSAGPLTLSFGPRQQQRPGAHP